MCISRIVVLISVLCFVATVQASVLSNGDFEDTSGTFPNGWDIVAPAPSQHAGLKGTSTGAYFASSGTGEIGQSFTETGPQWQLDFYFAMEDPGDSDARALNFKLYHGGGGGHINLRANGDGDIQTCITVDPWWGDPIPGLDGKVTFSVDANGDNDFEDVGDTLNVHRMRVEGDYRTSSPTYTVSLSAANEDTFSWSGSSSKWWGDPVAGNGVYQLKVTDNKSSGDYLIDEISLTDITPPPIPGDADGDFDVDDDDAAILASFWLQTSLAGGASEGDFDGDGDADDADATIMAVNWGVGVPAAVPEPGTLALLLSAVGSVFLVFYRQRRTVSTLPASA